MNDIGRSRLCIAGKIANGRRGLIGGEDGTATEFNAKGAAAATVTLRWRKILRFQFLGFITTNENVSSGWFHLKAYI